MSPNPSTPPSTPQKRIVAQRSSPSLRPQNTTALASRVSEHIASTTYSLPPSPVKHSGVSEKAILSAPDVISSPYTSELSKVYGSVLQPKGTLESFHCHVCSASFPPDATIYPRILQTLLEGASCAVLASLRMVGHVGSAWNVRVLS